MNALASPVEGRSFQMKAENAGNLQASRGDGSQSLDDLTAIGDEGRQAARGPRVAVRLNDASNASFRWVVVEKNAPASVHLDVDESGCEDRICGKVDGGTRLAEADAFNPPLRDPDRPWPTHLGTVKDVLRGNRERGSSVAHLY